MKILLIAGLFSLNVLYACSSNNDKDFTVREYYNNGCLSREYQINDQQQKNGDYKEFYENCNVIKLRCNYFENKKIGEQREYYDDGKLKAIGYFKKSKIDSVAKWYYQNGKLKGEFFRLNGVLFGAQKEYYESGELKYLYFMKDDDEQLFSYDFDKSGSIISQSKSLIYCIYEKDSLAIEDTIKVVFYTAIPPSFKASLKIVEKGINSYYKSKLSTFDIINNNSGILLQKKLQPQANTNLGLLSITILRY